LWRRRVRIMADKIWKLRDLLSAAGLPVEISVPDLPVTQVTDDSRAVRKGSLFVAVPGSASDGHAFVGRAVEQGASAVLVQKEIEIPAPAVKIRLSSTRAALGPLAHAFWGSCSERLKVIGITGTKGKTTVAWLTQHLLGFSGVPCGLIGTVCHDFGEGPSPSGNTTPGAIFLQKSLGRMLEKGLKACAMEVSSHALDQQRTDGIRWACGVFTNLAPEHLDYHATMEEYLRAKLRLFQALPEEACAVVHRDDPAWESVRRATRARVLSYGLKEGADLTARKIRASLEGTEAELCTPEGIIPVKSRLIGLHNMENLLAAVGAALAAGVPAERAAQGAAAFAGVPGRLERIECGQPFPLFVDYAHTDGALRRVLEQLRDLSNRKILTVFGCGGDRDRAKRPRMGRAAAELSDRVIVTSDNPRSEDPGAIAREILAGAQGAGAPVQVILDRREAIRAALESADEKWLVLIAGKGHEEVQIFADRAIPFSDRAVARELLKAPVTLSLPAACLPPACRTGRDRQGQAGLSKGDSGHGSTGSP